MESTSLKAIMLSFLKLRGLQLGRILSEVGFIRILLLLVFCLHVLALIPKFFFYTPWLAGATVILAINALHHSRKDRPFLERYFVPYARHIMLVEYQLLALPATALLIYANQLWCTLIFVTVLSAMPYFNLSIKKIRGSVKRIYFLPSTAFEWKAGLRSNYISIPLLLLLGVFFGKLIFMPLLVIFLLTIILASFNNYCEASLMVEAFNRSPINFLNRKLLTQLIFMLILFLPINLSFMLFHAPYWYVLLAVNVIGLMIQALSICLKYAMYIPGEALKRNNLLLGLAIACFFIVFLAPVPLVLLVIYYRKAVNNLKPYCYAGNK
ncbi:hypothetical protein H8S90_05115 [Olivibacter sp. SDN3]|uniref:hypothetical protein n=1 Tax=Olivibacter sp. SDN3 TaxID=2764720 RepID=UPI00165153D6|nr:hypothetical protein [Olivibacter sp. SDN3]QNL50972.1 hypothetical protein H8S90_05115 [Olivibacter sp. SDN3]